MSSLTSNNFFDEQTAKIRSKPVPWEGYQRADLITSEELTLIRKVDRQPRSKTEPILISEGPTYALLYLNLLNKLSRIDTMQYILVLINEALIGHEERVSVFQKTSESNPEFPYLPLLKALETSDDFTQLSAAQLLTTLLCTPPLPPQVLKSLLSSISSFLDSSSPNASKCSVAVQCLESLLSRSDVRKEVWSQTDIIQRLVEMLKNDPSGQTAYHIVFCFWLLTFDVEISRQLNTVYDVIPVLLSVAQGAVKEKVIRVVVAAFRNLVTKAPAENLPSMLVAKVLPYVRSLAIRQLSDEEVAEDVQFLKDELGEKFESLTTYDEYVSELKSGHLSWTPVHESETFWRENVTKLNENDHEQIRILVRLLNEASDPLVLAVAAHDIGQYVKYCDRGKIVLTDLGAKTRVMELMVHNNPDVRYHALISVQRLVTNPWTSR